QILEPHYVSADQVRRRQGWRPARFSISLPGDRIAKTPTTVRDAAAIDEFYAAVDELGAVFGGVEDRQQRPDKAALARGVGAEDYVHPRSQAFDAERPLDPRQRVDLESGQPHSGAIRSMRRSAERRSRPW